VAGTGFPCGLDLDVRRPLALVLESEQVSAHVNLWDGHVAASVQQLRHDGTLAAAARVRAAILRVHQCFQRRSPLPAVTLIGGLSWPWWETNCSALSGTRKCGSTESTARARQLPGKDLQGRRKSSRIASSAADQTCRGARGGSSCA